MAKSIEERELIKQLKKEVKLETKRYTVSKKEVKEVKKAILSDLMLGEEVLSDNYPVYGDYLYVIETVDNDKHSIFSVIRSDIFGDVKKLKLYLNNKKGNSGSIVSNVYNCQMYKRNLF